MKEFKEFNDCWEDAAANSVSNDGVSMPADAVKKDKKKPVYDGRTKAGRKFVERMIAKRLANETKKDLQAHKDNMQSVQAQAYESVSLAKDRFAAMEARQMKDPKKDSMVVKNNKTIVIDKSKEAEYLKKGWKLAEGLKEKADPDTVAMILANPKMKDKTLKGLSPKARKEVEDALKKADSARRKDYNAYQKSKR